MGTRVAGFGGVEASAFTGIPYPTVSYWARSGFITPSISAGEGKGNRRAFSFADLRALRAAAQLRDLGIPLQRLREVVRALQGLGETLSTACLVVNDDDVQVALDEDTLMSLLKRPGQHAYRVVVDVAAVDAELRELIPA